MSPSLRLGAAVLGIALVLALGAREAGAKVYAVVVGIDYYAHTNGLNGAVNDARDIAGALEGLDAEITLLLDADATRAAILGAFRGYAKRARAGDSLVLTYAGHGMQEPEALPDDEIDHKDEVFVLSGFRPSGPEAAERIRDNEIAELFSEVSPDVEILFVADSCHSGTMNRGLDPRGKQVTTRLAEFDPITDDPLAPPRADTFQKEPTHLGNVVFAAAALDEEQTPEVEIDGAMRGALSWSVARAIEKYGKPDAAPLSLRDLRSYLRSMVRALSEARQTPDLVFRADPTAGGPERPLGLGLTSGVSTAADKELATLPAMAEAPPRLFVDGPAPEQPLDPQDATLVEQQDTADMVWDRGRGELIDRIGADMIAEVRDVATLTGALRKWRAVKRMSGWVPNRPLEVLLEPGDGRHPLGSRIHIVISRPAELEPAYVTIFNLASTGALQPVFPAPDTVRKNADVIPAGQSSIRLGPSRVIEPVGADHIVVVVSRQRLDALHALLDGGGPSAMADLAFEAQLRSLLSEKEAYVGLLPIFSERGEL